MGVIVSGQTYFFFIKKSLEKVSFSFKDKLNWLASKLKSANEKSEKFTGYKVWNNKKKTSQSGSDGRYYAIFIFKYCL